MESQGMSSEDPRTSSAGKQSGSPSEDSNPSVLKPQVIPTAKIPSVSPRLREQALPEKDDDRFFDRWVVDKAQELGSRAVKRQALDKLKDTVLAFAKWRSLRHAPALERENMADKSLVASTPAKIDKARKEAERSIVSAKEAEEKANQCEARADDAADELSLFRPALRGTEWDVVILLLANAVIFAVDIFVIHAALGRIPGNEQEYWLTAITMGAGAVVIGDALGWISGVGAICRDNSIGRPGRTVIAVVAGLLILSVWFFVELGEFREFAIVTDAKRNGVILKDPSFFTIAQILFLMASAVTCFAYIARRSGRELLRRQLDLRKECEDFRTDAKSLDDRAEQARLAAAEAPVLCEQAKERIAARAKIAAGNATRDLSQGDYLKTLIVSEYMKERADVESGARYWQFAQVRGTIERTAVLRLGLPVAASLAGGGIAFWVLGSLFAAVVTAAIIAAAFLVADSKGDSEDDSDLERQQRQRYVAQLVASTRKGADRAGDIERLVPFPASAFTATPATTGSSNGGQDRRRRLMTKDEQAGVEKATIVYRKDD